MDDGKLPAHLPSLPQIQHLPLGYTIPLQATV